MGYPICTRCKKREVEVIDDWQSDYCPYCNDTRIEVSNKIREWDHFHPGEPMPKSERDAIDGSKK